MSFEETAQKMIVAMEAQANRLNAQGVIVVALMDEASTSWESRMRVVGRLSMIFDKPNDLGFPGCNFVAIAHSKAAEMVDTKCNSGSEARPVLQGEFGYPGGLIRKVKAGYALAVFSGATGEEDTEISMAGLDRYVDE